MCFWIDNNLIIRINLDVNTYGKSTFVAQITDVVPKRPVLTLSKHYRRQRESHRWRWATTITSAARRWSVPHHPKPVYKRYARMDNKSLFI
jgi:hypothetical protein